MLNIRSFTYNPFYENTYLIYDETLECVIIDAGMSNEKEEKCFTSFMDEYKLKPKRLLNTHCHIDHILGNYFVSSKYNLGLEIHPNELPLLNAAKDYSLNFGITNYKEVKPSGFLNINDKIIFGNSVLDILFVPGHSPGHIAFYNKEKKICFSGDVLFKESIGRTDLPGGDFDTLIRSINKELFTLDDNTIIYPGHGAETDIGYEKRYNPFLK